MSPIEYFAGAVPQDHPALACSVCEGEGGWLEPMPASCAAVEPSYRSVTCNACDGDRVAQDFECGECEAELSPLTRGVGAVIETEREEPRYVWAPDGPRRKVRTYRLLCGACAWEDLVADDEKGSSPPPEKPIEGALGEGERDAPDST